MLPLLAGAAVFGALFADQRRSREQEAREGHTFVSPAPVSIPGGTIQRLWTPWNVNTGRLMYSDARQRLSTHGGRAFYGGVRGGSPEEHELLRVAAQLNPQQPPTWAIDRGDHFEVGWSLGRVVTAWRPKLPSEWKGKSVRANTSHGIVATPPPEGLAYGGNCDTCGPGCGCEPCEATWGAVDEPTYGF